jgi:hypothetical protein
MLFFMSILRKKKLIFRLLLQKNLSCSLFFVSLHNVIASKMKRESTTNTTSEAKETEAKARSQVADYIGNVAYHRRYMCNIVPYVFKFPRLDLADFYAEISTVSEIAKAEKDNKGLFCRKAIAKDEVLTDSTQPYFCDLIEQCNDCAAKGVADLAAWESADIFERWDEFMRNYYKQDVENTCNAMFIYQDNEVMALVARQDIPAGHEIMRVYGAGFWITAFPEEERRGCPQWTRIVSRMKNIHDENWPEELPKDSLIEAEFMAIHGSEEGFEKARQTIQKVREKGSFK